jgi:hypothetical protein
MNEAVETRAAHSGKRHMFHERHNIQSWLLIRMVRALVLSWLGVFTVFVGVGVFTGALTWGTPVSDTLGVTPLGRWLGIGSRLDLLYLLAAGAVFAIVPSGVVRDRHLKRVRADCCWRCGYEASELRPRGGHCPECGALPPDGRNAAYRNQKSMCRRAFLVVLGLNAAFGTLAAAALMYVN